MSGRIIPLHGDHHDEVGSLLPWYVTGRLDAGETARVEAHLKTCAQCQADLAAETGLQAALKALPETETETAEDGWAALRPRLTARPRGLNLNRVGRQWRQSAPWLRWAVAAQFALLAVGTGVVLWQANRPTQPTAGQYHTLGSAPEAATGNVVVVFRPETTEADLRGTLRDSHARLVDGPTVADAYILHVAPQDRDATVVALRKRGEIVLAEPIDGAAGEAP